MQTSSDSGELSIRRARILLDPLSYINPRRLKLRRCFDTPRHRALINQMILRNLPSAKDDIVPGSYAQQKLEQYWSLFPFICGLVGAQILKSDLARGGRSLRLPESIRAFMALPLQQIMGRDTGASERLLKNHDFPAMKRIAADPLPHLQKVGLSCILNWQRQSSMLLLSRFQLLFPPELDPYFDLPREQVHAGELFLISQAIQYAKNHTADA